ncbi:MAG: prohibitin family protein [Fimbriimonadaceae bacterium]
MGALILGILLLVAGLSIRANAKNPEMKKAAPFGSLLILGGIAVAIIGTAINTVVIVKSGYVGVLLQTGAAIGQKSEGMHFLVPGVQELELMEVRTQKVESNATAASRDLQPVTVDIALNYRIDRDRASDLYKNIGTEYAARIISPTIQEAIKVVTAQYTAEDLIRQRGKVKTEVESLITNRLQQNFIIVDPGGLSITNFEFSPEFNKAIELKQIAQQDAEKQKFVLQRAELEKQTKIAQAQGEAEAAKLNAQALQAAGGELVVAREWIEKWDGQVPQVSGGQGMIIDLGSILKGKPATSGN